MTRLLFVPNPNTLLWLELDQPEELILAEIQAGAWRLPAPFDKVFSGELNAALQDGVITITLRQPPPPSAPAARPTRADLSRRQLEVLRGLADGLTTRQLCLRLRISPRTVYTYIAGLKTLFGAQTRAELLAKAAGIIRK